jgi:hypothetical protein
MTKKDFELIAKVVREAEGVSKPARERLATAFARELHHVNSRFDKDRFCEACRSR